MRPVADSGCILQPKECDDLAVLCITSSKQTQFFLQKEPLWLPKSTGSQCYWLVELKT
jgi:hypothetical protein